VSAAALSFIAIEPCDSPCFVCGPYTLESIDAAPPFAVFKGDAEDPGPVVWEIFDIGGNGDTIEQASDVTGLLICASEPERDDEACSQLETRNTRGQTFDDNDACLAYLRAGGALCKVHDYEGSPHYRLLVVEDVCSNQPPLLPYHNAATGMGMRL
jgi:hypothetical protein